MWSSLRMFRFFSEGESSVIFPDIQMSRRSLLRALDISTNLHESRSRLERSILRASRVLTKVKRSMDMDEIFLILKESYPVSCNTLIVLYACISDNFFGGYPLYYWMILCGDKWVVRVISDSNKVNLKKGD